MRQISFQFLRIRKEDLRGNDHSKSFSSVALCVALVSAVLALLLSFRFSAALAGAVDLVTLFPLIIFELLLLLLLLSELVVELAI